MLILALLLVGAGLFAAVAGLVAVRQEVGPAPTPIETALGLRDDAPSAEGTSVVYRALEPVVALGIDAVRRLSPRGRVDLIRRRIVLSGQEGSLTAERVLAYKAVATVLGFLLLLLFSPGRFPLLVWALFGGVFGFFLPDILIGSRADSRQKQIGRDLPEALDLLAITVEAGLGLEQALEVVSDNLEGPLGAELVRLLREIELGVSRRDALSALRDRTDVPELSAFVVSLVQADAMGVAVADVLKSQAAQTRLKRRQAAREAAAKTPVKILFPVIFGILPALFVVTIGPGAISIIDNLFSRV